MSDHEHTYEVTVTWTGNLGDGTASYRGYGREHAVTADGPPPIEGSADPAFRGDPARWNPEQLLVASLSQCHMLWYLHLAAEAGLVVTAYTDRPRGTMVTGSDGSGRSTRVILRPDVTIRADSDSRLAERLHQRVPQLCFIARSVSFPVDHEPRIRTESAPEVAGTDG